MHVTIARTAGVLLTALLATPLTAAAQTTPAQSAERSRTQGIKETDRFVKAGNNAHASIANARLEAKNTLDRYNRLVTQPSKNMKGDYKKLMGALDDMNEEVADARLEITNMRANGDTYFTGRETTNKAIQDQQLQSTAATRLATSRKDFDTVLASLRAAGDALEVFQKALADQITFLVIAVGVKSLPRNVIWSASAFRNTSRASAAVRNDARTVSRSFRLVDRRAAAVLCSC